MSRLCGLNPEIDYTPVRWAILERRTGRPPDASASITLTAYEGLPEEDRAVLILLGAWCCYSLTRRVWTIQFKWKGHQVRCDFDARGRETIREYLGYFMDWGVFPVQEFNFEGVIHGSENR